ncbi:MAG: transcriptional repressor [Pirellulales bacterium]
MAGTFGLGSVEVALSPLARFEEFLQSRGKKLTRQKKALVEHVFSRHEHFDAEVLIAELTRQHAPGSGSELAGQRVSRPTVYRVLAELVDAGLLRKMTLRGRTVFEHDYGYPQHDHLYCSRCERLIEFQSDELARLRDAVAAEHRFQVTGHRFIITGLCQDCRSATRRGHRPLDRI